MKKGGAPDAARPLAPMSPRDFIAKKMREMDEADSGKADEEDDGGRPACETGKAE